MPKLPRADVDGHWLAMFERRFLSLEKTRAHFAAELDQRIREINRQLVTAESAVTKLEAQRARLDDDYLSGTLSAESFEKFSARLDAETVAATAQRDQLRASSEAAQRATMNIDAEEGDASTSRRAPGQHRRRCAEGPGERRPGRAPDDQP